MDSLNEKEANVSLFIFNKIFIRFSEIKNFAFNLMFNALLILFLDGKNICIICNTALTNS